jgi:hypothetical protein
MTVTAPVQAAPVLGKKKGDAIELRISVLEKLASDDSHVKHVSVVIDDTKIAQAVLEAIKTATGLDVAAAADADKLIYPDPKE